MWIKRDFLDKFDSNVTLEALLIRGPRQIGKTSLLLRMSPAPNSTLVLDDPGELARAREDAAFVISQLRLPALIDEIQRAPELLPPIKQAIDLGRQQRLQTGKPTVSGGFRMTGSNQTQLEGEIRETLAGRISLFRLHGLSVHELLNHDPNLSLIEILFRGGFPELWVRPELSPVSYLNDYFSTFVERDVAALAGVEKLAEFGKVVRLSAARVGQLLSLSSLSNDADVALNSVKGWLSLLEQNGILYTLRPYHTNLNLRLIKAPKIYFVETAFCARMQGHREASAVLSIPQAGHLFENLVVAEVLKTRDHFRKDWELFFWRTKDGEEIDLVVETNTTLVLAEIKLGSGLDVNVPQPEALLKTGKNIHRVAVVATGERRLQPSGVELVPLSALCEYLLEVLR